MRVLVELTRLWWNVCSMGNPSGLELGKLDYGMYQCTEFCEGWSLQ